MKRSALQRRTPLRSRPPARREARQVDHVPAPVRPGRISLVDAAQPIVVAPKFPYIRDERLRDMCRAMACQHCGAAGDLAGVTWAHSNQGRHGKAQRKKASDQFVAALCFICHRLVDQSTLDAEVRLRIWTSAHHKTVALALVLGTWPAGVPVPPLEE